MNLSLNSNYSSETLIPIILFILAIGFAGFESLNLIGKEYIM